MNEEQARKLKVGDKVVLISHNQNRHGVVTIINNENSLTDADISIRYPSSGSRSFRNFDDMKDIELDK